MRPPVAKSDAAFRTIGEAAEAIGVPHHVLRFWETRFPQLQPMKRGGGRRYYRPGDMDLLRTIHAMLHDEGLTIRGAQKALAERASPVIPAKAGTQAAAASALPDSLGSRFRGNDGERSDGLTSQPSAIDLTRLRAIRDRLAAALAA